MSFLLIIFGLFGKFTGVLASMPDPIIGGSCLVGMALVVSVGISQLHMVDVAAVRNQMALGMAIILGIMLPLYIKENQSAIRTGNLMFTIVLDSCSTYCNFCIRLDTSFKNNIWNYFLTMTISISVAHKF